MFESQQIHILFSLRTNFFRICTQPLCIFGRGEWDSCRLHRFLLTNGEGGEKRENGHNSRTRWRKSSALMSQYKQGFVSLTFSCRCSPWPFRAATRKAVTITSVIMPNLNVCGESTRISNEKGCDWQEIWGVSKTLQPSPTPCSPHPCTSSERPDVPQSFLQGVRPVSHSAPSNSVSYTRMNLHVYKQQRI